MILVVGLGNPGEEYVGTRHNIGFQVLDVIASDFDVSFSRTGFKGTYSKFIHNGDQIFLLKPGTYMNLSGLSVKEIMDYYHIDIEDLIVVSDDLDLPPGSVRIRENGTSGGHKGLQSIIDCLNSNNFKRIRVGIGAGKPLGNKGADFVLGKPKDDDKEEIDKACDIAAMAIEDYIKNRNFSKTCSLFNRKVKNDK